MRCVAGIEVEEHQRVGAVRVAAARSTAAVGADDEDGRRLGQERAVALRELRLRVRAADAAFASSTPLANDR